jgi:hypothetical protein
MTIFLASYTNLEKIGIANYLKTLYSCHRANYMLTNSHDTPCVDKKYAFIFENLFSNINKISNKETDGEIDIWDIDKFIFREPDNKVYAIIHWQFYISENDGVNIPLFKDEWFNNQPGKSIDCRYTNIPEHIISSYRNIMNEYSIRSDLLYHINTKLSKINSDFLGVHIRTWRNNNDNKLKFDNRWSNERFNHYQKIRIEFINAINKSSYNKVLICTDNRPDICENIIPFVKNKDVILYEDVSELNEIQNDFIELQLLSKSSFLIGSLNSTFSELAWWYGGIGDKVDIF